MTEGISNVILMVLGSFKRLSETIHESDDDSLRNSLLLRLDDELTRLKVWAGDSGANLTGPDSLEHRLRDASHVRQQVLRLLSDLKDSLEDAADIMAGNTTPWEETEGNEEPLEDLEAGTEMEQIALDITEMVDCLLRLNVSIQNPAPHDYFTSSVFTDVSAYEDFDIQHVQDKFKDIEDFLAQRLGKAMSRRRQYFKYRETHQVKFTNGLNLIGDTSKAHSTLLAPGTLASSMPLKTKQEAPIDNSDDDTQSDEYNSVTSFAMSDLGPKTLKVPSMPERALEGPFTCPFCYLIISVQDARAWKQHVFNDLRPYNCLARHCTASGQEFTRQHEWMQHMLQNHLRVYRCPCGCPDSFSSALESRNHLLRFHIGVIPETKVDSVVELNSQPLAQDAHTDCPFCPEKLKSLKQYRLHVGYHQQDLALFVLPEPDRFNFNEQGQDAVGATVRSQEVVTDAEDEGVMVRKLNPENSNPQTATEPSKPRTGSNQSIDLNDLLVAVGDIGGYAIVTARNLWADVCASFGIDNEEAPVLRLLYETHLLRHESGWIRSTGHHRNSVQIREADVVEEGNASFPDEDLSGTSLETTNQRSGGEDRSADKAVQPRLLQNVDRNTNTSRSLPVSPKRSFLLWSAEESRQDQIPDNLDMDLPPLRGVSPSPPRSVSSWYDEPSSAALSEEDDLPINSERSPDAASSGLRRHQSFENDHERWPSHGRLKRASSSRMDINTNPTRRLSIEELSKAHRANPSAGNKQRAYSTSREMASNSTHGSRPLLPSKPVEGVELCGNCLHENTESFDFSDGLTPTCRKCMELERKSTLIGTDASLDQSLVTDPEYEKESYQQTSPGEAVVADFDNEQTRAKVPVAHNEVAAQGHDGVELSDYTEGRSLPRNENVDNPESAWIPNTGLKQRETAQEESSAEHDPKKTSEDDSTARAEIARRMNNIARLTAKLGSREQPESDEMNKDQRPLPFNQRISLINSARRPSTTDLERYSRRREKERKGHDGVVRERGLMQRYLRHAEVQIESPSRRPPTVVPLDLLKRSLSGTIDVPLSSGQGLMGTVRPLDIDEERRRRRRHKERKEREEREGRELSREETERKQPRIPRVEVPSERISRRPIVPPTHLPLRRVIDRSYPPPALASLPSKLSFKDHANVPLSPKQGLADAVNHEIDGSLAEKLEHERKEETLRASSQTALKRPVNQQSPSIAHTDVPLSRDLVLVDAARRLDINERLGTGRLAREQREREEEDEAQRRRLMERMRPRRRATVGPGSRRHRVLYDDELYRWE